MSFDLCQVKMADKPFFIESITLNIYSIEELCYYLKENLCLIDESIMNENFCGWIRDELGLKRLYRQLHEHLEKQQGIMGFILPIFREIGYLDAAGMKQLQDQLNQLDVQPADSRQKMKGDYLVRSGMYAGAVREYRQILERKNPGKLSNQFYAQIWNNLGCAYARQFCFEQAADSFLSGWKLGGGTQILRNYLCVLPLFLQQPEYQQRIALLDTDPSLISSMQEYSAKRCEEIKNEAAKETVLESMEQWIEKEKEAYRRSSRLK